MERVLAGVVVAEASKRCAENIGFDDPVQTGEENQAIHSLLEGGRTVQSHAPKGPRFD